MTKSEESASLLATRFHKFHKANSCRRGANEDLREGEVTHGEPRRSMVVTVQVNKCDQGAVKSTTIIDCVCFVTRVFICVVSVFFLLR